MVPVPVAPQHENGLVCVSAWKMEGVCIRLNSAALTVTAVKNVLVVTDGWENGTDARKDGQMNDRTVEGDSLL